MAKIRKVTDKIKVQIEDVSISISPLSKDQKEVIMDLMFLAAKGDMKSANKAVHFAMKYSIKGCSGFEDDNGDQYVPSFENGVLTDESVEDFANTELKDKINSICVALLQNVPSVFKDAEGKPLEGVKILPRGGKVEEEGKN